MNIAESSYLLEWKDKMKQIIRLQYSEEELSEKKLDKYLDSQIEKNLNDHKLLLVNNYNSRND